MARSPRSLLACRHSHRQPLARLLLRWSLSFLLHIPIVKHGRHDIGDTVQGFAVSSCVLTVGHGKLQWPDSRAWKCHCVVLCFVGSLLSFCADAKCGRIETSHDNQAARHILSTFILH